MLYSDMVRSCFNIDSKGTRLSVMLRLAFLNTAINSSMLAPKLALPKHDLILAFTKTTIPGIYPTAVVKRDHPERLCCLFIPA